MDFVTCAVPSCSLWSMVARSQASHLTCRVILSLDSYTLGSCSCLKIDLVPGAGAVRHGTSTAQSGGGSPAGAQDLPDTVSSLNTNHCRGVWA